MTGFAELLGFLRQRGQERILGVGRSTSKQGREVGQDGMPSGSSAELTLAKVWGIGSKW